MSLASVVWPCKARKAVPLPSNVTFEVYPEPRHIPREAVPVCRLLPTQLNDVVAWLQAFKQPQNPSKAAPSSLEDRIGLPRLHLILKPREESDVLSIPVPSLLGGKA